MASLVHQLKITLKPGMGQTSWGQLGSAVSLWSLPFMWQPKLGAKQRGWKAEDPSTALISGEWESREWGRTVRKGKKRKRREKEEKGAPEMLSKTEVAWGVKERSVCLSPPSHSKSVQFTQTEVPRTRLLSSLFPSMIHAKVSSRTLGPLHSTLRT